MSLKFRVLLATISFTVIGTAGSVPSLSSRIVGGLPANDTYIPYIVSLVVHGFHSCGGSIINERTIITAAHCLIDKRPSIIDVHVGNTVFGKGILIPVEATHYPEKFNSYTMDFDVGLVRMTRSLVFSSTVKPIQLPQPNEEVRVGILAIVAGWGLTSQNGIPSRNLLYARVPIIDQESCNRSLCGVITDRMLCAGYWEGGIDACQMDSGGPLTVEEKLIGIVSWGIGCALPDWPSVYTRVAAITPWVSDVMSSIYNESIPSSISVL